MSIHSQQILEKLFDSPAKLRLLKLFLRNPEDSFTLSNIKKRLLLDTRAANRELARLQDIELIKSVKKGKKKEKSYFLNSGFIFLKELKNLILQSSPADQDKMTKSILGLGKVRLAVISGIFIKPEREHSRTDLLLVCDRLDEKKLRKFVKNLEAEAGTELNYTVLNSAEFAYRQKMFDRFVLDILEKPHKMLANKILR